MALCFYFEHSMDLSEGPKFLKRAVSNQPTVHWLEPPRPNGQITIAHVHEATTADEHEKRVMAWARDVWNAWKPHHAVVREWIDHSLE